MLWNASKYSEDVHSDLERLRWMTGCITRVRSSIACTLKHMVSVQTILRHRLSSLMVCPLACRKVASMVAAYQRVALGRSRHTTRDALSMLRFAFAAPHWRIWHWQ